VSHKMNNQDKIKQFRKHVETAYGNCPFGYKAGFDEILCYELHSQPVNPRMTTKTVNNDFETGLTFKELAQKWGVICQVSRRTYSGPLQEIGRVKLFPSSV